MAEADKPLVWLKGEVHSPPFSKEARVETGTLLRRLQRGETLAPVEVIEKARSRLREYDEIARGEQ